MKNSVRFVALILIISIISPVMQVKADNSISARSAVLLVADTCEIAYSQNPYERLPMASTTKIISAIVALENIDDISDIVTIPDEACNIEGSSIYLYPGEELTYEILLYGMLLNSGNDAAVALAILVGGSVDNFVSMMNTFAASLNLKNTHFVNPNGLNDENHYTSAYDLAIIMRYAMQNDTFAEIVKTKSISFRKPDGTYRYFSNHNRLLNIYKYATGGKTGYTKVARRCLVTSAEKDGVSLICVTLDSQDDYSEHQSLYEQYFPKYKLYRIEKSLISIPIVDSKINSVKVYELNDLYLPFCSDNSIEKLTKKIIVSRHISPPISKEDIVGKINYYYDGVLIYENPLVSADELLIPVKTDIFKKIKNFIRRLL